MKKSTQKEKLCKSRRIWATCLIFVFLFTGVAQASNHLAAQTVTAKFKNVSLNDVIWELQKQTDFTFIYSTNDVNDVKIKDVNANDEIVTVILDKCLKNSGLTYSVHNGVIAIKKAQETTVEVAAPEQRSTISGQVVDETGEPMPGVNVLVKGSQIGAITDMNGNFSVTIDGQSATLQLSFIGYATQEVNVTAGKSVKVVMRDDNALLDEVVVVAFGTSTRQAFTGSAAIVGADAITKSQQTNIAQTLAGRAPGVQLINESGQLNATPTIRIRGFSSINAGKDPLWVVDGIPYDGSLNHLNPNDIESMTVLKDAASNALYGARGANGVIMVTTKKARTKEAVVTVDAKVGINQRALKPYDYITDPGQYYEMHYAALRNSYLSSGSTAEEAHKKANSNVGGKVSNGGLGYMVYTVPEGQDFINSDGHINPAATLGGKYTNNGNEYLLTPDNWLDAAYRETMRQEYNVSISGMTDRSSFYASFGYLKNEGIVYNNDYTRYSVRLRSDYQAKNWLKIGGNIAFTNYTDNYIDSEGESSSTGNVFAIANRVGPVYPLYIRDADGNIMTNEEGITLFDYGDEYGLDRPLLPGSNALSDSRLNTRQHEGNSINATGFADINFLKDFKFTFNVGTTLREYRSTSVRNPYFGQFKTEKGSVTKYHRRRFTLNLQQILNYNKQIGKHNINAMIGHEYYSNKFYYLTGSKNNMFSQDNKELAGAVVDKQSANSYITDYNNEGYLARVQYDYDNKYFGSASYRYDASSRFHPDNRWGSFWSLGGAWLVSKEDFMIPFSSWLDQLKFKMSIGSQGNDDIGDYYYTNRYGINNNQGEVAILYDREGNKDISWETNTNFNVGLEFSLFKGLLTGGFEYFYKKTTDMLFSFKVAPSLGYPNYMANIGDMINKGIEMDLTVNPIRTRNFNWDININFTHLKNEITMLADEHKTTVLEGHGGYISGSYFYGEGLPLYTRYMKKYAGVNENGQSQWYMDKKDGSGVETTTKYADATQYIVGDPIPDLYGGFGTSLNYRGFDFSINFNYQIGGMVYDSGYAAAMTVPEGKNVGHNFHKDMLKAWSPDNKASNIPRLNYGDLNTASMSDRFLTNASF